MAEEIEWENLLLDDDFFFHFDDSLLSDSPPGEEFTNSSSESVSSWIGQIENMLMNDDDVNEQQICPPESDQQPLSDSLAKILAGCPSDGSGSGDLVPLNEPDVVLVDSPADDSGSGKAIADRDSDVSDDTGNGSSEKENSDSFGEKKSGGLNDFRDGSPEKESLNQEEAKNDEEDNDDPVAKKRRRQLRNRDAAVRSREKKKIYLKDLESKSRYLERECLRLGRMLQCFVAENQALRLRLQKGGDAYDASMTKQESAVLLWESLLLGSLLVYLWGIICPFPQASLPPETTVESKDHPENVVQRGRGNSTSSNTHLVQAGKCLVKSRKCRASRTRMKLPRFFTACLFAFSLFLVVPRFHLYLSLLVLLSSVCETLVGLWGIN